MTHNILTDSLIVCIYIYILLLISIYFVYYSYKRKQLLFAKSSRTKCCCYLNAMLKHDFVGPCLQ